jgi:hypothetical protein
VNVEPGLGIAVSVTSLPRANDHVQVVPQLIPGGLLVTVPLPVPAVPTRTAYRMGSKTAVVFTAERTVNVHGPVLLHGPPFQPANVEPGSGSAVSVTDVPAAKSAAHAPPQLMPAGSLVTVPVPAPSPSTLTA